MGLLNALNRLDDAAGIPRGRVMQREHMIKHSGRCAAVYFALALFGLALGAASDSPSYLGFVLMFPMFQAGYYYNEKCRRDARYPKWDPEGPAPTPAAPETSQAR